MAQPVTDDELQLRKRARRRLVGAVVLVLLVVVFLPMLLDNEPRPLSPGVAITIPAQGTAESRFPDQPPGTANPTAPAGSGAAAPDVPAGTPPEPPVVPSQVPPLVAAPGAPVEPARSSPSSPVPPVSTASGARPDASAARVESSNAKAEASAAKPDPSATKPEAPATKPDASGAKVPEPRRQDAAAAPGTARLPDQPIRRDEPGKPEEAVKPGTPPVQPAAVEAVPKARPAAAESAPKSKPATAATAGPWVIQLGAFADPNNAKQLVERVRELDLPAYAESIKSSGRLKMRVRAGPFAAHDAADAAREKLLALKLAQSDLKVVRQGE